MKKIKLLSLFAFFVAIVTVFSSCSGAISVASSFDVVLNKDYVVEEGRVENVSEIEELRGYEFAESKGEFMIFTKGDSALGFSRAVFSARNKRVVYLAEADSNESVEISLYAGIPAFKVTKVFLGGCADATESEFDMVCEIYDATGTRIAESKNDLAKPDLFADILLCNGISYKINEENGSLLKISDIPEGLSLDACNDWNDKYFYTYGDTINVYDRAFKNIYSWTLPSSVESVSANVLNNGNIIVQYKRLLDGEAKNYDFCETDVETGEIKKFELTSKILDPEKKSEKALNIKYIINQITTGTELIRTSDNNGMYRYDVENLAYILPINDKQLDLSDSNLDLVIMDNSLRIKMSLMLIEDQIAAIPTCIGENVYMVATSYGSALVDIDGNVIEQINDLSVDAVGKNIVSEDMIYTIRMEEFYSLYDKDAEVITYLGGTVFLKNGNESEYTVIAICGTEEKEICKYNEIEPETISFEPLVDSGCYALCNASKSEYLYYNSEHKLLHTSAVRLSKAATDFSHGVTVYCATIENEPFYYMFY